MAGRRSDNNDTDIDAAEIALSGGNSNAEVIKLGDTVRRQTSSVSTTVHKLLVHLEKSGFDAAPRFLGIDNKGREILSYLEGDCSISADHWTDVAYLDSAAKPVSYTHLTLPTKA